MAFLRKEHKTCYSVISNDVFKSGLTLKSVGLLCTMLSLPEDWEFSISGIEVIVPDGKDAIRTCLKELEEHGFLERDRKRKKDGTLSGADWVVRDYVPMSDKPMSENPTQVNPTQQNTNIQSTNKTNKTTTSNSEKIPSNSEQFRAS